MALAPSRPDRLARASIIGAILLLGASASAQPATAATPVDPATPPNILLFLVDDLGWQDTSVPFHSSRTPFNDRYRTPNMERLADRGMLFTNAYAASPVCTPTRTSIMTGQNPARTHITNWTLRNNRDAQETGPKTYPLRSPNWDFDGLQPDDVTLPRLLHARNYRTIHVGKAHFGALDTPGADPTNLGFDINIAGHAAGAPASYYGTHDFSAAHRGGASVWNVPGLETYHGTDVNLTDALTREAVNAITSAAEEQRPFFLNMAHYAVHTPIMADDRFTANDPDTHPTEAAYASMIEGIDASLGVLLDHLDTLAIADNTLVLFMSDNGGLSAHARGTTPAGSGKNTHNLPLRSGKGSAYEGGIRVPMIIAWARPDTSTPAQRHLPIDPGTRCDVPVISDDLLPTLIDVAGIECPDNHAVDGRTLRPLLTDEPGFPDDRLLAWHYPHKWGPEGPGLDPFTAVRDGNWKLIYFYHERRFELYNLAQDLSETTDLVRKRADVAQQLLGRMQPWIRDTGAQMPHTRDTDEPIPLPSFE